MKRINIRLSIVNTDKDMIDWVQNKTSCGFSRMQRPAMSGRKSTFTWETYGANALSILKQINEFLITKKKRAVLAIEFQDSILSSPNLRIDKAYQKEFFDRMKILNQRGT